MVPQYIVKKQNLKGSNLSRLGTKGSREEGSKKSVTVEELSIPAESSLALSSPGAWPTQHCWTQEESRHCWILGEKECYLRQEVETVRELWILKVSPYEQTLAKKAEQKSKPLRVLNVEDTERYM